ncbi:MAG: hypothetical protein ABI678_26515 [Kofleriaceae bacterium]
MRKLVLVIMLLGCSDQKAKEAPAAGTAASDSVAKLQAFKAQMCACKDATCATTVNAAMEKWSLDKLHADDGNRPAVSPEAIQAQALLIEDIGKCKNAASDK